MNDLLLRTVLRLNTTTSLSGGAVAAIAPDTIDRLLGTGQPVWVRIVGLGLVAFAAFVAMVSRSATDRLHAEARVVSAGDAAWVVGTTVTIAAGWYSASGAVAMGLVAAMVAVFGVAQVALSRPGATHLVAS